MRESTCLQRFRYLGLYGALLCLLAGCSGSNESGEEPRDGQLSLQLRFAPQAVSTSQSAGLATIQVRQVEPGDPGFITRLDVRLQSQSQDLVPAQVFTLTTADQESVTQEVTLPDPVPATFQVLASAFTSQEIEVFRGTITVTRGQASAVVTLLRTAFVPVPVTPGTLAQRTFEFPDGTAFGLAQAPVTLATGTFTDTDTVGDFALVAQGLVASGHVELGAEGLDSCTFVVTTSAFLQGQGPQVGDRVAMHPCQSDAIDHRLNVTNTASSATSSVSSPPVSTPPESVVLPPPFTLVTQEDTSGTVRFAVSLQGTRPGTTSLAITTPPAHGTATLNAAGTAVIYQPGPDFNGSDRTVVTVIVRFTDNNVPLLVLGTVPITVTVQPVNDLPVVTNPGTQTTGDGAAVALSLVAQDRDGDPLTFSATGLPPGLSLNATTGVISGTIAVGAARRSPYRVTATVSDGIASNSQTFPWTVIPLPVPTLRAVAPPGAPQRAAPQ